MTGAGNSGGGASLGDGREMLSLAHTCWGSAGAGSMRLKERLSISEGGAVLVVTTGKGAGSAGAEASAEWIKELLLLTDMMGAASDTGLPCVLFAIVDSTICAERGGLSLNATISISRVTLR